jgi:hypothetical protein
MVHQKPLIAGYISRRTPVDPARLALLSNAVIGGVIDQNSSTSLDADTVRSLLKDNGVDVVVYHWQPNAHDQTLKWATQTFNQPIYADNWTDIFEVPAPAHHIDNDVYTFAEDGWWQRSGEESRWLAGDASLYLYSTIAQDRHWTLALAPLLQSRKLQLAVDGNIVQSWTIKLPAQQLDFWLKLEPGFHTLRFILPDDCVAVQVAPVCLRYDAARQSGPSCILKSDEHNLCVSMALDRLQIEDAGAMALQSRTVHLHDNAALLDLRGFRVPAQTSAGQSITVETDWLALQKLQGDYHLFIPILDQNGKAVAQADVVPGEGTYSTTAWASPQQWTEAVNISLPKDLPPGSYGVYAGWYRYPEITRLTVDGNTPHAQDGLVYLQDVTIK